MGFSISDGSPGLFGALFIVIGVAAVIVIAIFLLSALKGDIEGGDPDQKDDFEA